VALRTLARRLIGRIYHRNRPYKHVENSVRGVRLAKRRGDPSIDIDLQCTADGVIVACHDNQPLKHGFHDPLGRFGREFKISEHSWAEVRRLFAVTGGRVYRIKRIETILRACVRYRRNAVVEPKANRVFSLDWPWQHLALVAEDLGATVSVRALRELHGAAHIEPARRAGFKAWLI
jgi:glycerophosphoryl diester phosphodiesterase